MMSFVLRKDHWGFSRQFVNSRRSIGWLIGPPPEPFSKKWFTKWNRICGAVAVVMILSGLYQGTLVVRVFDRDTNEFSPMIKRRSLEQKKFEDMVEAAALKEKKGEGAK